MTGRQYIPPPESSAHPARGSNAVYAAIDLGTNNCRLLVAVPDPDNGFRVIDSFSRIVRLGEGLSSTGELCAPAIERTIDALGICSDIMKRNGAQHYHAIATEACRRAGNGAAFTDRVKSETGLAMNVISSQQEAELTFAGCSPLLDNDRPFGVVLDIGGGSSELMWIDQSGDNHPRLSHCHSIPEGVVTLADQFGASMNNQQDYENLIARILPWLDSFEAETGIARIMEDGNLTMLGTSGTVTTLGALHLGLRRYERSRVDGMVIDFDSIGALSSKLAMMTCDARASHPCIGPERADLVVMGCAILEAVCRRWPVGRLRVADRGIREGLLISMMAEDSHAGHIVGAAHTAGATQ
ncbi:MAG: Ppx/GppA family phosphatase [Rhodospirillales bacterium]|nr:Ppx/GppA family phosphatase [Rhodospirillales bacterium]MBT4038403.1 Ppx/GppA family phosphatase [Rhodospirillales bacterium]MBT5352602.1 Ppx/GppA family phosphatase [Rhodospirillales bacterium]MBT5520224.1 Ppx/GppA family phosphatase [Rhodospirillales bacterium]MBT6111121.1 Ppx/GppA family phosphatase [Rhodospirillales bacterium]